MTYAIIAKDIDNTPIHVGCRIKMVGETVREEFLGHEAVVEAPNKDAVLSRLLTLGHHPMIAVNGGVVRASDVEVIAAPEDPDAPGYDISIIGFDCDGRPVRAGDAVQLVGETIRAEFRDDINLVVAATENAKLLSAKAGEPMISLDDGMCCAASSVKNISSAPVEADDTAIA